MTPEFQNFVAKRLSNFLEDQLSLRLQTNKNKTKKKTTKLKTGVKLFRKSTNYLEAPETTSAQCKPSTFKKHSIRKRSCDSDFTDESTKISEAAVSPDFILSKKEVQQWSNRSKAPVFRYHKEPSGELKYIEPDFK